MIKSFQTGAVSPHQVQTLGFSCNPWLVTLIEQLFSPWSCVRGRKDWFNWFRGPLRNSL